MENTENRAALLKRIRALASKTVANGCSEAEALAAASLLGRLVDKYGFSERDIDEPAEKIIEDKKPKSKQNGIRDWFAMIVATFTDTRTFRRIGRTGQWRVFLGMESDVLIAWYILDLLTTAHKTAYEDFKKDYIKKNLRSLSRAEWRNLRLSFDMAMYDRVGQRLKEMKVDRNNVVDQKSGQRTAVMVLSKQALVDAEFDKKNLKGSHNKRKSYSINDQAASAGRAAGDRVSINQGVQHNSSRLIAAI